MEVTPGDKKKQEEILERVKQFMSERIGCYDDEAKKNIDHDVKVLQRIVDDIIDERYERDCDNWSRVGAYVINKHKHHMPVPYWGTHTSNMNIHELKRCLDCAISNAESAIKEVDNLKRQIHFEEDTDGGTVGRLVRSGMHPLKAIMILRGVQPDDIGMSKEDIDLIDSRPVDNVIEPKLAEEIAKKLGVRPEQLKRETYAYEGYKKHTAKYTW